MFNLYISILDFFFMMMMMTKANVLHLLEVNAEK